MSRYLVLMKDHELGEETIIFRSEARPSLQQYMDEHGHHAVRMATRQALVLAGLRLKRQAILDGERIPNWNRPVRVI